MLTLLQLLLDLPAPSAAMVQTQTFAKLSEHQARKLEGKRVRYLVQLDSPETDLDGFHCFGCQSENPADDRGVLFCPWEVVGENEVEVEVEAELRVRHFGAWQGVAPLTLYELYNAVRVRR